MKDGTVIATAVNEILATNDPTNHAEMVAIRAASQALASPDLSRCIVCANGHPCPMCMAAMRMPVNHRRRVRFRGNLPSLSINGIDSDGPA